VVLIAAGVLSAGLVAVLTLVTEIAMGTIEPARAGAAAAVLETGSEFGGALGIAILGSVGAAIYGSQMIDSLPAGLPSDAAAAAQETLAGATVVAGQLPADSAAAVLTAARDAFTVGMHGVGVVGAIAMLLAAVVCIATLRQARVSIAE
jgi:DHA2 family multidrug resistance protein-like MFS transporter